MIQQHITRDPKIKSLFGVFSCILICTIIAGCRSEAEELTLRFERDGQVISPELHLSVADDEGERRTGLMYRKYLEEDRGMLFVFPDERNRSFWMKNTYIPLDIIFINSRGEVVSVAENAEPLSEGARKSEAPAQYVVEVGAGLARAWGVRQGTVVLVDGALPVANN